MSDTVMYKILVKGKGPFSGLSYKPRPGRVVQLLSGIWFCDSLEGTKLWTDGRSDYEVWEVEAPLGYTYISKYASTALRLKFVRLYEEVAA